MLATEMIDEPEDEAERNAHDETRSDGKVEGGVFAAMDYVPRKAEGELTAKKEKCAHEEQDSSEDEQSSTEIAEIHTIIMRLRRCGAEGRIVRRWIRRRW